MISTGICCIALAMNSVANGMDMAICGRIMAQ